MEKLLRSSLFDGVDKSGTYFFKPLVWSVPRDVFKTRIVNDVIAFESDGALHVGQVWAHCEVEGVCFALIQQLELISSDNKAGTAIWKVTDAYDLIGREMIRDALIWNDYEDGRIRTILPRDLF